MRPRTLVILFVLVAVLGAFVWFVERDLPGTEERAEQARRVLSLESDEVSALTLEWGEERVRLVREEAGADEDAAAAGKREWRLEEPLAARADGAEVTTLLDSLGRLEKKRTLAEPDRAGLGLEAPRATVTFATGDGETVLEIGAEVPASDTMVMAVRGRPEAYVVADTLFDEVTREPGEWRNKEIFHGERSAVASVRLEPAAGEAVLLSRRGEDFWVEVPVVDRADRDRVNRLLGELVGLRASRFVDDPQGAGVELGLEPPAGVMEVVLDGEEQPFRLEVGAPVSEEGPARYARAGGLTFETASDLGEWLATPAADWRSHRWTALDSWDVEAARFEDGEGTVAVERSGGDWKRGDDRIPYTPVSTLLATLTSARADSIVPPAEAAELAAGEPLLTVTLTGREGKEETLILFAVGEGGAPARTSGRDALLLLPPEVASDLTEQVAALRAAEPLPPAGDEIPDDMDVTVEEGDS